MWNPIQINTSNSKTHSAPILAWQNWSFPEQIDSKFPLLTERNLFTCKVCPKQTKESVYDPTISVRCVKRQVKPERTVKNNTFCPSGVTAPFPETHA